MLCKAKFGLGSCKLSKVILVNKWKLVRPLNNLVMLDISIFREKLSFVLIDCGSSNEYEVCTAHDKWSVTPFFNLKQNKTFTYSQLSSGTTMSLFGVNKSYMKGHKRLVKLKPIKIYIQTCLLTQKHDRSCVLHTRTGKASHLELQLNSLCFFPLRLWLMIQSVCKSD